MTKIDDGKGVPEEPIVEQAHQEIELNASKFLNALESYQDADSSDRAQLKTIMDQTLHVIKDSVNKIKRAEIYKQELKFEKDYNSYIQNSSQDNFSTLEKDLGILRDYNKIK